MRFVSPLLKKVVYPALHRTGGLRFIAPAGGCAVLSYHGILPAEYHSPDPFLEGNLVCAEALRKQLRFLKAQYEIIRPDEFRAWILAGNQLPAHSVLVTCDDGLLNTVTDMLPVLRDEGIYCLFFVTGASCSENPGMLWYEELYYLLRSRKPGEADLESIFPDSKDLGAGPSLQTNWWGAVCGASRLGGKDRAELLRRLRAKCPVPDCEFFERRWRLLNEQELRQLLAAGMTIGAHTMSHPVLSECTEAESYREIHESKVQLERVLGQPVWAFAYPFGNGATMSDREVGLAERAGFECGFLNTDGGFADRSLPYRLSRTHITNEMSLAEIEVHMSGLHARLQRAVRG